ncbi:hypothetical protein FVE85_3803 [Porphyridium purpureum]|uniref:Uncharacterized protein n=1 Tax=Porphyridium purpureum TaxID=35688 RepID=A0A5J4YIQ1_PORPP|nr:hypothetical protein FVE85_3803 [Porphyridium purpureum]|eukprot:POR1904..scf243_20
MARSVCAALPLNDKVEGSGIDARSSRKDESQDGTQNAGALTLREENTAATNEGHVVDPTIEVQGSNAQARRNWSHVMNTTLRTGPLGSSVIKRPASAYTVGAAKQPTSEHMKGFAKRYRHVQQFSNKCIPVRKPPQGMNVRGPNHVSSMSP